MSPQAEGRPINARKARGRPSSQIALAGVLLLTLGLTLAPGPSGAAGIASRTFDAPIDRVWTATESALKRLGWDIDTFDRAVGWILTDSRAVDFKEFAVYGKGLRHKLRLSLKTAGPARTTVTVERELYEEKRVLWMIERKPVAPTDQTVETGLLDAIQQGL
jgi:hypothetical protein